MQHSATCALHAAGAPCCTCTLVSTPLSNLPSLILGLICSRTLDAHNFGLAVCFLHLFHKQSALFGLVISSIPKSVSVPVQLRSGYLAPFCLVFAHASSWNFWLPPSVHRHPHENRRILLYVQSQASRILSCWQYNDSGIASNRATASSSLSYLYLHPV